MCRFYGMSDAEEDDDISYIIGEDDGWDDCSCEDSYDDENEREWCD